MNYFDGLQEIRDAVNGEKVLTEKELEAIKQILRDYDLEVK